MGGIEGRDDEENCDDIAPLSLYLVLSAENMPRGPRPNPEPRSKPRRCCRAATEGVITLTGGRDICLLVEEILVVRKSGSGAASG
jgi:hypothetical protein